MNNKNLKTGEVCTQIRSFFNDSIIKKTNVFSKKQDGDWNQCCAAMDIIEDTCLAIHGFQQESNNSFAQNPYILTYGILQALFIQQDAVNYLKMSLFGQDKKIDWKNKKYSELFKIRQIRNETVGHPVKVTLKGKESKYVNDEIISCTIDRSSISKEGFHYILWMHSKNVSNIINFSEIIKLQDKYLGAELQLIMKEMQKEEKQHKAKFNKEKLSEILNKPSVYKINSIYGVRGGDSLAWLSFDYFYKLYKKIRKGLEARYGKFGETLGIPGTEEVVKKLDFVFSKIEIFKNTGKFENYEFEVYIDALKSGINELQSHLVEVDHKFEI